MTRHRRGSRAAGGCDGTRSDGSVDGSQRQRERRRGGETLDTLRRQQTQSSAVDAVASPAALFQLLLEVEAHQVLARDDADDAVGHVDDGQVPEAERAKHDVRPMQREFLGDVRRGLVDERLLQTRSHRQQLTVQLTQDYYYHRRR